MTEDHSTHILMFADFIHEWSGPTVVVSVVISEEYIGTHCRPSIIAL